MAFNELKPQADYFYCLECKKHVPCIRLEPGVWDVQCVRCMGECGLCDCRLAGRCFGKNKVPMQMHMYVVEFEGEG